MDIKAGDIVNLRHRLWRVDHVEADRKIFQATNIDGDKSRSQKFYYPLESIKEAHIEAPSLDKIGVSATNKLLIQSFRYSILHGSAPLLSLQRSCVIPTQYQLVPVVMALNKSERVRMLIADDVGLGKTIEAGLIATELLARNLISRILVIAPKNLCEQWCDALNSQFQIDARTISSVDRRILERKLPPGASPWKHYPFLIASIDYVKRDPTKYQALEVSWDLVIVDEAHLAAKPHQTGENQNISMERYNFIEELSKKKSVKHLLFLTATPHNGYTDTYASLLDMLDCGIVAGPKNQPRINKETAKEHVCQRRRKDVEDWFKEHSEENPFPARDQSEVTVDLAYSEEKDIVEKLEHYGKGILSLAEGGNHKTRITAQWVVMHLQKRALSSPHALRQSLQNRLYKVKDKINKQETAEESYVSVAQAKANALDEETVDDLSDEEVSERMDRTTFGSIEALQNEAEELENLIELAKKVTSTKDSKLKSLTNSKNGILKTSLSGAFETRKVIIFTRFKDTLDYLEREIPKQMKKQIEPEEIITVHGDLTDALRNERLQKFQSLDKGVLIATDCISEGINLQYMANQVIHYELPWNPNRLEQRNGRVDRYGQRASKVFVRTIVMNETLDAAILKVLVKKAMQIREDYGFAPPFFGDDISVLDFIDEMKGEKLPKPQRSLTEFNGKEASPQESKSDDKINPFDEEILENIKSESFYGQTDVDLTDIRKRLKDTEESLGTPDEFKTFVINGFKRFGCVVKETNSIEGLYRIELSNDLQVGGRGRVIEKATFDPKKAIEIPDVEHLNVGHPVIKRLFELVKSSVFNPANEEYGRTAVITTQDVNKVTALYHFLVRFSVGTKSVRVIEEIIPVACNLIDRKALSQDEIAELMNVSTAPSKRQKEDFIRHLKLAMEPDMFEDSFEETVQRHVKRMTAERHELKEKLMEDSADQEWLEGIDNIEMASKDLISVRLYEPVPKLEVE